MYTLAKQICTSWFKPCSFYIIRVCTVWIHKQPCIEKWCRILMMGVVEIGNWHNMEFFFCFIGRLKVNFILLPSLQLIRIPFGFASKLSNRSPAAVRLAKKDSLCYKQLAKKDRLCYKLLAKNDSLCYKLLAKKDSLCYKQLQHEINWLLAIDSKCQIFSKNFNPVCASR